MFCSKKYDDTPESPPIAYGVCGDSSRNDLMDILCRSYYYLIKKMKKYQTKKEFKNSKEFNALNIIFWNRLNKDTVSKKELKNSEGFRAYYITLWNWNLKNKPFTKKEFKDSKGFDAFYITFWNKNPKNTPFTKNEFKSSDGFDALKITIWNHHRKNKSFTEQEILKLNKS